MMSHRWPTLLFAGAFLAVGDAHAHEFETLEVSRFSKNDLLGWYEIEIANTSGDEMIVCALYDSEGKLLSSTSAFTSNLATKVLVQYDGDDVESVKCALN